MPPKLELIQPTRRADKQALLRAFLKNQEELAQAVNELRREVAKLNGDLRQTVSTEVLRQFGDQVTMIEAAVRETLVHKEILIRNGFLSRQAVNEQHAEMRKTHE